MSYLPDLPGPEEGDLDVYLGEKSQRPIEKCPVCQEGIWLDTTVVEDVNGGIYCSKECFFSSVDFSNESEDVEDFDATTEKMVDIEIRRFNENS